MLMKFVTYGIEAGIKVISFYQVMNNGSKEY